MKVIIYTTPTCHFCHMAKEFFKENNIEYKEIDVSADQEKGQEMIEKSGQMGVPVIEIDEKILIGFNQEELKKVLKLK